MATLIKKNVKGGYIYYVNFIYQGKRYRKSTTTSDRKLAKLILRDIELKIVRESFGFGELESKKLRLAEFFDKYLEFSLATKAKNSFLLDKHSSSLFLRFAGNVQLTLIQTKLVEDFKVSRLYEVKPSSVNLELRHLKSMFQSAVEWGYLDKNPCSKVRQVKIKNSNLPKYFTKQQVREILAVIPEGKFKNLIRFYLHTGCRRGEALGLNWDDIDLNSRRITIRESKSGESRIIPINSELYATLVNVIPNGNVVFDFSGGHVTHKFKRYLKVVDTKEVGRLTIHSLRHTFASHLVMAGVDLYTVAKLLGHSSVAVTEMYVHLAPDHLKVSVEKLCY